MTAFIYFFFRGFLIAQPSSLKSASSHLKSLLPFLKYWRQSPVSAGIYM